MLSLLLYFLILSPSVRCNKATCNTTFKHILTEGSRAHYDHRPNIFIDENNLLGHSGRHKKEFTYGTGPYGCAHWPRLYPKCGGKHQSPINIDIPTLKTISLPNLNWNNRYQEIPDKITVSNTHNTIVVDIIFKDEKRPSISGGPLGKEYALKSIHFHWSSNDHKGSEHTVNKKTFPMEMHVVHYRADLNFSKAISQEKGLCVVAYIFELTNDKCNEALSNVLSKAEEITMDKDMGVELINLFRLDTLVDTIESDYVTYAGSLTTPPCYESVIWIISPYTIKLAKNQIERFRIVSTASGSFGDNYRPVQSINDRVINFVKNDKN